MPERARRSRQYPAKSELRALAEYDQLDKAGNCALLRRMGLYSSLISEWRTQRDRARWKRCRTCGAASRSIRRNERQPG